MVDRIYVLKPIRFESIRRNEVANKLLVDSVSKAMKSGDLEDVITHVDADRQQRAATVLRHVDYVIEAHFELGFGYALRVSGMNRHIPRSDACQHVPVLCADDYVAPHR